MGRNKAPHLGPIQDGQTVAIIGGGPGGVGCALALQQEAQRLGRDIQIVLFEGKRFGEHYNQCAGVLSPPCQELLQTFDLSLPADLIQRKIAGYVLYGDREQLYLPEADSEAPSLAVQRAHFDRFLLAQARSRGVEIVQGRVTDVEFHPEGIIVYSWSGTYRACAVVGAFGLSKAMAACFARRVGYVPPPFLETLVANFYPNSAEALPDLLGNLIHVFLPRLPRVEFGALIPKSDHLTVILAGWDVSGREMDAFLALPLVRALLPATPHTDYFKGRFPIGLARRFWGDRYVLIGDAAGLVRPFKGKGINSALFTGRIAAETLLQEGLSRTALARFHRRCHELTGDLWYGRLMRRLAHLSAHLSLDPILRLAQQEPHLRQLLFDCVSGRETYRNIVCRRENLGLAGRLAPALLRSWIAGYLRGSWQCVPLSPEAMEKGSRG